MSRPVDQYPEDEVRDLCRRVLTVFPGHENIREGTAA